ncbi:MAG: orotate phosphoribosyltransferase [Phototrophicaceae bacterium]
MSEAVARALIEIGAVGFSPQNPITFKSGIVSPIYVDNRRLPYYPEQWQVIIQGFQALIEVDNIAFDVIAGVAVGGVPHSSALGYAIQRPSVFVRKEAKGHGKGQRVEGGDIKDKTVLLVEDLVTTGGSSLSGVQALRDEGALVDTLIAIVSYGFDDAQANFASANVDLKTLTNFETILNIALELEKFGQAEHDILSDWFSDPHGWASRHLK